MRRLIIGTALTLSAAGMTWQRIAEARDRRLYRPPGQLLDVGGHRLHIQLAGHGSPAVVLESGLGGSSLDWWNIAPAVANFTRVVSYDRAGLGWSEHGPNPRTSRRIARELGALLRSAGVAPPYVLVGQSFGGIHARLYASTYPHEVAGMVLVDASHEDQGRYWSKRPPIARLRDSWSSTTYRVYPALARLGVLRLRGVPGSSLSYLPPALRPSGRSLALRSRAHDAVIAEICAEQQSYDEVSVCDRLGDLPLIVLTALWRHAQRGFTSHHEFNAFWMDLQSRLAALSTKGVHIVANTDEHFMQHGEPALVIDAIEQMVETVRRTDAPASRQPPTEN